MVESIFKRLRPKHPTPFLAIFWAQLWVYSFHVLLIILLCLYLPVFYLMGLDSNLSEDGIYELSFALILLCTFMVLLMIPSASRSDSPNEFGLANEFALLPIQRRRLVHYIMSVHCIALVSWLLLLTGLVELWNFALGMERPPLYGLMLYQYFWSGFSALMVFHSAACVRGRWWFLRVLPLIIGVIVAMFFLPPLYMPVLAIGIVIVYTYYAGILYEKHMARLPVARREKSAVELQTGKSGMPQSAEDALEWYFCQTTARPQKGAWHTRGAMMRQSPWLAPITLLTIYVFIGLFINLRYPDAPADEIVYRLLTYLLVLTAVVRWLEDLKHTGIGFWHELVAIPIPDKRLRMQFDRAQARRFRGLLLLVGGGYGAWLLSRFATTGLPWQRLDPVADLMAFGWYGIIVPCFILVIVRLVNYGKTLLELFIHLLWALYVLVPLLIIYAILRLFGFVPTIPNLVLDILFMMCVMFGLVLMTIWVRWLLRKHYKTGVLDSLEVQPSYMKAAGAFVITLLFAIPLMTYSWLSAIWGLMLAYGTALSFLGLRPHLAATVFDARRGKKEQI